MWWRDVLINAQRKIVVDGWSSAVVIDADTGARTQLPGSDGWVKFDNDRVLRGEPQHDGTSRITEWDLDGVQVATYDGGVMPLGKNSGGTVLGTYRTPSGADVPSLWGETGRTDVVSDEPLFSSVYADITDDGTLIGTYSGTNGIARPARWVCG